MFDTELLTISTWINNDILHDTMYFFSKMLHIHLEKNVANVADQCTINSENNRRNLIISTCSGMALDYSILHIKYRYFFEYYSHRKRYVRNDIITINNNKCRCIKVNLNGWYTFSAYDITIFHFTFHKPSHDLYPTDKYLKSKGGFHIKIDSMIRNKIIPFRPFIVQPDYCFCLFNQFDPSLLDIYTTRNMNVNIHEITPFLLHNTDIQMIYPNDISGTTIHYLDNIIQPIYDKIVTDLLNPIASTGMVGVRVPIAEPYVSTRRIIHCRQMMNPIPHTTSRNTIIKNTTRKGGRNKRKYTRKLR